MNFYQLELQGQHSESIESLPSYLIRLAIAHGRTVGQLLERMIADQTEWSQNHRIMKSDVLVASGLAFMVRPTRQTDQLVNLIEKCCGVTGLRGSTLLSFEQCSLRSSLACYARYLRWCPRCFSQDKSQRRIPYLRLLWSLQPITSCSEHGIPLVSRCVHCQKPQSSMSRKCPVDVCTHCGLSLACDSHSDDDVSKDDSSNHAVFAPLVKAISSYPELTYPPDATRRFINWIVNQSHCYAKVNQSTDHGQPLIPSRCIGAQQSVSLAICIRITTVLKIDLNTYLGGDGLAWNRALFVDEQWDLPELPDGYTSTTSLTRSELTNQIESLREQSSAGNALTLSGLSEQLGISLYDIVYLVPDLADEIITKTAKQEIVRKELARTRRIADDLIQLGREVSPNPRVRITALLQRDFPDVDRSIIDEIVGEAITDIWPFSISKSAKRINNKN